MFYKKSDKKVMPINKEYNWIKDQFHLYELLLKKGWSKDTCAPRLRDSWNDNNKTCGQCSITAFLVQDIFGGEVYGVQTKCGIHCFNVIGDVVFDLTSEQFKGGDQILDYPLNLPQHREEHFSKQEKYERYQILKSRVKPD